MGRGLGSVLLMLIRLIPEALRVWREIDRELSEPLPAPVKRQALDTAVRDALKTTAETKDTASLEKLLGRTVPAPKPK